MQVYKPMISLNLTYLFSRVRIHDFCTLSILLVNNFSQSSLTDFFFFIASRVWIVNKVVLFLVFICKFGCLMP